MKHLQILFWLAFCFCSCHQPPSSSHPVTLFTPAITEKYDGGIGAACSMVHYELFADYTFAKHWAVKAQMLRTGNPLVDYKRDSIYKTGSYTFGIGYFRKNKDSTVAFSIWGNFGRQTRSEEVSWRNRSPMGVETYSSQADFNVYSISPSFHLISNFSPLQVLITPTVQLWHYNKYVFSHSNGFFNGGSNITKSNTDFYWLCPTVTVVAGKKIQLYWQWTFYQNLSKFWNTGQWTAGDNLNQPYVRPWLMSIGIFVRPYTILSD